MVPPWRTEHNKLGEDAQKCPLWDPSEGGSLVERGHLIAHPGYHDRNAYLPFR